MDPASRTVMPRCRRPNLAGLVVHVLNRSVRRVQLFSDNPDYEVFEHALVEARRRFQLRLLAFCVMPNHWHMLAWPRDNAELSRFMQLLTVKHASRWHASRGTGGTGHVYQGRFKCFPIQSDDHLLRAYRYVERNALRANLVARAEDWRWGSLWHRIHGDPSGLLSEGPVELPDDWVRVVNEAQSPAELAALRRSVEFGTPFGSKEWTLAAAARLGLASTLRPRGRPLKPRAEESDDAPGGVSSR